MGRVRQRQPWKKLAFHSAGNSIYPQCRGELALPADKRPAEADFVGCGDRDGFSAETLKDMEDFMVAKLSPGLRALFRIHGGQSSGVPGGDPGEGPDDSIVGLGMLGG